MHIPDGYLSPTTCAALYAAAAPFWYTATQRLKRQVHTRLIPLVSLFAAFSFVIMMFNLPLPGGTTGHAVGVGIATIVLGPWGAMLSISVALLIQALFFGDGGVTAIGANCFNIAIVGSLVAYGVYLLAGGRSSLNSTRRIIAAGLAGYCAINVAALFTAIEFGIQPLLYKDAGGAPLYAPYPLGVVIPAMMIGHLTFAGLAEFIVTAGVMAWLQHSDPSLLKLTAPHAIDLFDETGPKVTVKSSWRETRRLWIGLAALMILTPLGLLATGMAWGEWGPEDFTNPQAREQITAASRNQAPPAQAPEGFKRLASTWTAPIPGYAPPFLRSEAFGYILSAMFGVGLIILTVLLFRRVVRGGRATDEG
jgi:cobalt/nickel transport system permease protein